jgi:predicted permease
MSVVLLIGAALLMRSFVQLRRIDLGFTDDRALTMRLSLPNASYRESKDVIGFFTTLRQRLAELPGVQSVGATRLLPLTGTIGDWSITLEGRARVPGENPNGDWQVVMPGYFESMGVKLVRGRFITDGDHADAPIVAVINETMAKRYWPEGKALGGKIRLGQNLAEVIGIVADSKYSSINERPLAQLFFPMSRSETSTLRLFVKTAGDPAPLVAEVRNAIRGIDATLPVYDARTLNEHMQIAVFAQRMAANLLGAMGVLALLLAAIGLYGVMAYAVSQRTQELGIRLALGASPGSLLGMIVGQGMKLTVIGLAIGLAIALGAFGSIGAVRSLLPGISPMDPITFVTVPIVLGSIALLASWIPGRRAGKVDPLVALRYE